ncbi:MAG: hypothetical protein K2I61_05135, partial [Muribaculaceae bacterium]|nr:hypothetical protein [Muribaculaceae bacterium]
MSAGFVVAFELAVLRLVGAAVLDAALVCEAALLAGVVFDFIVFSVFAALVVFAAFGAFGVFAVFGAAPLVFASFFTSAAFFAVCLVSEAEALLVAVAADFDRLRLATGVAASGFAAELPDLPDLAEDLPALAAFDGPRLLRFTGVPLMAVDSAMASEG